MVLIVLSHPSEGDDYSSVQLPSVITARDFKTGGSVCYKITPRTDDTLEGNETIRLQLSTTESFVAFTQPNATFTILDSVSNSLFICVNYQQLNADSNNCRSHKQNCRGNPRHCFKWKPNGDKLAESQHATEQYC